jgi:NADPH-dependent ferric siderophore reductase
MRTYTIRALRREACEVDVDFVLHGVNGPASAWATTARMGDRLQMVAPNLAYAGDPGGYEWKPRTTPGTFCWWATKPPCRPSPASSNNWPTRPLSLR